MSGTVRDLVAGSGIRFGDPRTVEIEYRMLRVKGQRSARLKRCPQRFEDAGVGRLPSGIGF